MQSLKPCLIFTTKQAGRAEDALNFYGSIFNGAVVESIVLYRPGADEPAGYIKRALCKLNDLQLIVIASSKDNEFSFTPAISIFIECQSSGEIDRVYRKLSRGGVELMALENYRFSQRFGWVNDRYGVSWQLNLPCNTAFRNCCGGRFSIR